MHIHTVLDSLLGYLLCCRHSINLSDAIVLHEVTVGRQKLIGLFSATALGDADTHATYVVTVCCNCKDCVQVSVLLHENQQVIITQP